MPRMNTILLHGNSVQYNLRTFQCFFQELIAYGVGNVGGSFTSCFAICNALARTAVQENLANTQVKTRLRNEVFGLIIKPWPNSHHSEQT